MNTGDQNGIHHLAPETDGVDHFAGLVADQVGDLIRPQDDQDDVCIDRNALTQVDEVNRDFVMENTDLFGHVPPEKIFINPLVRKHISTMRGMGYDKLDIYYRCVVGNNQDLLLQKTLHQKYQLQSIAISQGVSDAKISEFRSYLQEQEVVHYSRNHRDTYDCARTTGNQSSFGAQDFFVQADKYVYASVSGELSHLMANSPGADPLDMEEASSRSQLVMIDIADCIDENNISYDDYYQNLFDYKEGLELLAIYLATVFDHVEQAKSFFDNMTRMDAQAFLKGKGFFTNSYEYGNTDDIYTKMRQVYDATGIIPPLGLEVRIEGSVMSKPSP